MKTVSEEYKKTVDMPMRPQSLFKANLNVVDRTAVSDSTITTSGEMPFCTSIFAENYDGEYITMEKNFFEVGGSQRIAPSAKYLSNGYVSSEISNAQGKFSNPPVITIQFTKPHDFIGIDYWFGSDYPTSFKSDFYGVGGLIDSRDHAPTAPKYVDRRPIEGCTKIVFTFNAIVNPHHRLRLNRIVSGSVILFDNSTVLETEQVMFTDPVSSSLSYNKITISVDNFDKKYNPDNPQGLWRFFKNGQILDISYGVQTSSGIEWLNMPPLMLRDAPTVGSNRAKFEAADVVSYLTDIYVKGMYYPNGRTMYDLASDVLLDAGITNFKLSEELRYFRTVAPLPVVSYQECLQIIANASNSVLYVDTNGVVTIEYQSESNLTTLQKSGKIKETENYRLGYNVSLSKPVVRKKSPLRRVEVVTYHYSVSQDVTELYTADILAADHAIEYQVDYNSATDVSVEVANGEILNEELYASHGVITLIPGGNCSLTVRGHELQISESITAVDENSTGEVCPIQNPLITDRESAIRVGKWVGDFCKNRSTYDIDVRQDFRLEPNDLIGIQTEFEDNVPAKITKLKFNLPGQHGNVTVRRLD